MFSMTKGTKIALIGLVFLGLGVGIYMLISKNKTTAENKEKNDRKIVIARN